MKKIIFSLFSLFLAVSCMAQTTVQQNNKYVPVYVDGAFVTNLPKQKTAPKGSVYMVDDWMNAQIVLRDSSCISNVKANYNLFSKYVEIKDNNEISLLNFSKVDWIVLSDQKTTSIYENCTNYMIDYPELGQCEFTQVLASGDNATLLDKLSLDILYSNYNAAVNAGSTSDTYILKHEYYIIKDKKLYSINKTKSSVLTTFDDQKDKVKLYIKVNKLKMKNPQDIANVVNYYNSLYEQTSN